MAETVVPASKTDRSGPRPGGNGRRSEEPGRPIRRAILSPRVIQVALGLIWLADGALQLQPYMFGPDFLRDLIASNAQGQPGLVHAAIVDAVQIALPHPVLWNAGFALIQIAIGLGLVVSRRTVRPALALSFGWAAVVWLMGEGLGMLVMGTSSPLTGAPGAVLLYALIGVLVWPRGSRGGGPDRALVSDLVGRLAWALLWLLLAGLMLLPFNSAPDATRYTFAAAAAFLGGSGPLAALDTALAGATAGDGLLVSIISAVLMAAVGLLVLVERARNGALAMGAAIGVFLFLTTQFLGGILTGYGTDPGTGPPLVLFAALLWARPPARHERTGGRPVALPSPQEGAASASRR